MTHKRILKILSLLIFFGFGLDFFWIANSPAQLEPGIKAPGFKLPSLDGNEIALQDLVGKIVILHLWKCK